MGCCGCSNQSSAITAGIFGLIQSLIGVISYSYFWSLYSSSLLDNWNRADESLFLLFETRNVATVLRIILAVVTISHVTWFISSIVLLIGTCTDSACCVRQWVVITSFIIIGDILLPGLVIGITISEFSDVANSAQQLVKSAADRGSSSGQDGLVNYVGDEINRFGAEINVDVHKYYILLILSFTKGFLITIITNICLTVFTNRRARELLNPQAAYVMMAMPVAMGPQQPTVFPVPQQIQFTSPTGYPGNQMQQFPYAQQPVGFHSPPSGFVNPHFNSSVQPQLDEPEQDSLKQNLMNDYTTSDRARLANV